MVVVKLKGGLGNQMFQYATGKALSIKNNTSLRIDLDAFENYHLHDFGLNHFNITDKYYKSLPKIISKILLKLGLKKNYSEKEFIYNPSVMDLNNFVLNLDGYFQCEDYFKSYRTEILKAFKIVSPFKEITKETLKNIKSQNSVSIHIRRGDYVNNKIHDTDKTQYYKSAMSYIESKIESPVYYLFSDDIDWVKSNFVSKHPMIFIDFNDAKTNFEDIKLMSNCKHNIIANSSFSWWSAWLNTNSRKIVVAPKKWFNGDAYNGKDVVPKSWITF